MAEAPPMVMPPPGIAGPVFVRPSVLTPWADDAESERFLEELARARCARSCRPHPEFALEACTALRLRGWAGLTLFNSFGAVLAAVRAGDVRVRRDAIAGCVAAAYSPPACYDYDWKSPVDLPECRAAFAGRLDAGARCSSRFDCKAPLECVPDRSNPDAVCELAVCVLPCGGACPAGHWCRGDSCVPRLALDADCSRDDQCESGFCDTGSVGPWRSACRTGERGTPCAFRCRDGLRCVDHRCGHRRARGEECRTDTDCVEGLRCADRTCGDGLPAGEQCTKDSECEAGLACRTSSLPASCELVAGLGAPCVQGACPAGLRCGADSVCHAPAGEGESCELAECAPGLACDPRKVCARVALASEECADAACAPGLSCAADGRCHSLSEVGRDCDPASRPCPADLLCRSQCVLPAALGESCRELACAPGLACEPSAAVCVPGPGTGEGCGRRCLGSARDCGADACARHAACAEGICRFAPTLTRKCYGDAACAPGEACVADRWEASTYGAEEGRCVPLPGRGERCERTLRCLPGSACVVAADGQARCEPAPTSGRSCGFRDACAQGHACVRAPPVKVCAAPPGAGESCDSVCAPGSSCRWFCDSRDGRCLTSCQPESAPGATCQVIDGVTPRPEDLSLVCVPLPQGGARWMKARAQGEPCTELLECGGVLSGLVCDLASGRCVPGPGDGEPCLAVREFLVCDALHAFCDTFAAVPTCRAFLPAGGVCMSHLACGVRAYLGRCDKESQSCGPLRGLCSP